MERWVWRVVVERWAAAGRIREEEEIRGEKRESWEGVRRRWPKEGRVEMEAVTAVAPNCICRLNRLLVRYRW